jgi:proteasome accessory factor A
VEPCPKILGADFELANALVRPGSDDGHVHEAARLLLDEIPGYPRWRWLGGTTVEWGRRFLSSCGGSAYIDSGHLEINLPEHGRAADHAALMHAGFRIAEDARAAASAKLSGPRRLNVLAAVSDGRESWGHHMNVLVRRELFDDLFRRKPHLAGFVATHLATATLYTGHGQAGAGNGRAACAYQLSQRADWFEELMGWQTTHRRPLLNQRDEPHAGDDLARLHIIFFDNVLAPMANYLKAGTTQLVLALAEAGWVDPSLLVDDPLAAAAAVSRDLSFKERLRMAGRGRAWTAIEVQQGLANLAGECVASGKLGDAVPGAAEIVACWQETLDLLAHRDLTALARRCDWALKYLLLHRQCGRHGLSWHSPEVKRLDLEFSSLDANEGLFWQMAAAGQVDDLPAPERVERFVREPPEDTRAYLRAHLLRRFGDDVIDMSWERIRFRVRGGRHWFAEATLALPDPAGFGREAAGPILERCQSLDELLEAVEHKGRAAPAEPVGFQPACLERRTGLHSLPPLLRQPYPW